VGHSYDERTILRAMLVIRDEVSGLTGDPYRSLAALVRDAGRYVKTPEPFAEFQWAAFCRTRIRSGRMNSSSRRKLTRAFTLGDHPITACRESKQPLRGF
jgi:hypothetical protein